MRTQIIWGDALYVMILKNGGKITRNDNCFSHYLRMSDHDRKQVTHIEYKKIRCKLTDKYYEFYLQYLIDMFKLEDTEIKEDSFRFKVYDCEYKTLVVLSCVRFLYERIGYLERVAAEKLLTSFFDLLQNGKSKYRNKLKRFCDFYSRIFTEKYWHEGHSWKPVNTKIKSTQDFLKVEKLVEANYFFENE